MKEIKECIEKGIRNAYADYVLFRPPGSNFPDKIIEYLFTVSIAKKLKKSFPGKGSFGIYVEYPYLQLIELARSKHFSEKTLLLKKTITRKELKEYGEKSRIDVVLQGKAIGQQFVEDESNFAIELKGINPSFSEIIKDIKRLMYALSVKDKDGNNYISHCFFAYLKRLDSNKIIYDEKNKQTKLNKYKKKLDLFLQNVFKKTDLKNNVEYFDIDSTSIDDYERMYPEDDMKSDEGAIKETGAIMGIIISFKNPDYHG